VACYPAVLYPRCEEGLTFERWEPVR